jgi:hypothetical protein
MIYFDLHGVISNLSKAVFGFEPPSWHYKIKNENLLDKVEADVNLLECCPPTEYYDIISELQFIFIISSQPEHWREKSDNWLWNHFNPENVFRKYVNSPQEKLDILKPGDLLVEDYPFFKDYSQIILIDRLYNQKVKTDRRVKTPAELREYIFN